MKRKSISKIISDAFATSRNSFKGVFATYMFVLGAFWLVSWTLYKYYFINIGDYQPFFNMSVKASLIYIAATVYGCVWFQVWQVLVIRNNLFYGESRLKQSFLQAAIKSLSVICFSVLQFILLALFVYLCIRVFPSYIVSLPFMLLMLMPLSVVFFIGLIVQEDKFLRVLKVSFRAALLHYIRTLVLSVVFVIIAIIFMSMIAIFLSFVLNLTVFLPVRLYAFNHVFRIVMIGLCYIAFYNFSMSYFVEVFYAFAVEDEMKYDSGKMEYEKDKERDYNVKQTLESDVPQGMVALGENNSKNKLLSENKSENKKEQPPKQPLK